MTTSRADHIKAIEAAVGDARNGLPDDIFRFVSRLTPLVTVDLLIKDDRSRTLLTWRDDEFFGPGWHLPGGIVRYKETAADRIRACARQELGAEIECEPAPLLVNQDIAGGETRGHHISLLYRCRLLSPADASLRAVSDPPAAGQWRWHDEVPRDLLEEQRAYTRFF